MKIKTDYELLKEAVRKTLVSCPNFASNEFVKNDLNVQRALREIEEENRWCESFVKAAEIYGKSEAEIEHDKEVEDDDDK